MDFARVLHRNYLKMIDFVKDVTKVAERNEWLKSAGVYAIVEGGLFLTLGGLINMEIRQSWEVSWKFNVNYNVTAFSGSVEVQVILHYLYF